MSTFMGAIAKRELAADEKRRRVLSQHIREAREEVSSTTGLKTAFDLELVRIFAQNRTAGWIVMLLLAAAMSATQALLWVPPLQIIFSATVVIASQALSLAVARRFQKAETPEKELTLWRNVFLLTEMIASSSWCLLLLNPAFLQIPEAQAFSVFCALLVIAVITTLGSSIPRAVVAGILPLVLLMGIELSLRSNGLTSRAMGGMMLASGGFFMLLAYRFYNATLETIEHRAEKDALIGELAEAKAMSDQARKRAEEANLAKSRFLATMSHELRTPLNAILGFSEVMKDEVLGQHTVPTYREYSNDIHSSGQHLLALINEILDLSRIEAGKQELQEGAVSLVHAVQDCEHLVKMRAQGKNITIVEAFQDKLPRLWADERAVRQVVLNLLTNAIKFTPQGGEIRIKVGWTGSGGQYVSIKDNGPGIPEDEIPIVLNAFGRGNYAIKTAEQGTGLGLPIVKALMENHNGRLDLRSKLREGTEVIASFPSSRVMDTLEPIAELNTAKVA